jgi:hypothetical protein
MKAQNTPHMDTMRTDDTPFSFPSFLKNTTARIGSFIASSILQLGEMIAWPDTIHLHNIALHGADLEPDFPYGTSAVSKIPFRGDAADKQYMINKIILPGIPKGHFRKAKHSELPRVTVHPSFCIIKNPRDPPSEYKRRDITNFAALLDLSSTGRPNASFNSSTPLHRRASISPGNVGEICRKLQYLLRVAKIRQRNIRLGKLDLSEAYKHIRLHPSNHLKAGMKVNGITYLNLVLPFGCAASASIYVRFMNLIQAFASHHGIITVTYIDDILVIAVSPGQAHSAILFIRKLLRFCGVKVNETKSMHHGATCVDFIGVTIDTLEWSIQIQKHTQQKVTNICHLLRTGAYTKSLPEHLEELCGCLTFMAVVIPVLSPARAYLYYAKAQGHTYINPKARRYLLLIEDLVTSHNKAPIASWDIDIAFQHDMQLGSDASSTHLGALAFAEDGTCFYFTAAWDDLPQFPADLHINDKEYLAHVLMVHILLPLAGPGYTVVPSVIDNKAAEAWVNKSYARYQKGDSHASSARRNEWVLQFAHYRSRHHILDRTRWIPTYENKLPDALTRPRTKHHVFTNYILSQGITAIEVTIPVGWTPARMLD